MHQSILSSQQLGDAHVSLPPPAYFWLSVMGYGALICAKNISQAHGPGSSCCHGSLKNRNKMALIGVYFQPTLSSHESRPEV